MTRPRQGALPGRSAVLWSLGAFVALQAVYHYPLCRWLPQLRDVEYGNKLTDLRRHLANRASGQPVVLAFGSSLTAMGLNPSAMAHCQPHNAQGPLVYNFSINGGSVMVQLLCFRRLLAEGIYPDCVLLETHPLFFLSEGKDNPRRKTRDWPATRVSRYDLPVLDRYYWHASQFRREWWSQQLMPWYAHRHMLQNWLLVNWVPESKRVNHNWRHTDSWGWEAWPWYIERQRKLRLDPEVLAGIGKKVESWNHQEINTIVNETLYEVLNICKREGIRVVLLWVPESSYYRDHYSEALEDRVARWFADVQEKSGARVVNARAWVPDNQFCDNWHLDPDGAATYSRRLETEVVLPLVQETVVAHRKRRD